MLIADPVAEAEALVQHIVGQVVASGEAPADFSAEEIGASAERLAQLTGIGVVIGIVLLVGVGA